MNHDDVTIGEVARALDKRPREVLDWLELHKEAHGPVSMDQVIRDIEAVHPGFIERLKEVREGSER